MDDDFVGNDFLAKRQWNHLAQILKGSSPGLDPSLFKRTFRPGDWAGFNVDVPAISYRDSEYYFSIAEYVDKRRGIVPGSFAIARRPGEILSFEVLQPLT